MKPEGPSGPAGASQDERVVSRMAETRRGRLDLAWMARTQPPVPVESREPHRGLTLEDINVGPYSPDRIPEIVRHNDSMAPRGSILSPDLPSFGYTLVRRSEVWADAAPRLYEELAAGHWAPAHVVPWSELRAARADERFEAAAAQLCTVLSECGLLAGDVASRWVWCVNMEFHEVKYLLAAQMAAGARLAEAFRKRALAGFGSMGTAFRPLEELARMLLQADTYPEAIASLNLMLLSWVQGLIRHFEASSDRHADAVLGRHAVADVTRLVAFGVEHLNAVTSARAEAAARIDAHLDAAENGLVGVLGAPELLEPAILLSGGFEPVRRLYGRVCQEYLRRCEAAGLRQRARRSPLPGFLALLADPGPEAAA